VCGGCLYDNGGTRFLASFRIRCSHSVSDAAERAPVDRWPTVSAIIPSYNRPELLGRAVESVLAQDYPGATECIIVRDHADAPSPPEKQSGRRRVVSIRNKRTPGLAGSRNHGAQAASGELFAFLDDDDEWLPTKLRRQVGALTGNARAAAASCGIVVVYGASEVPRLTRETITFADLIRSREMVLHSSTILVRRDDFFGRIGVVSEQIPGGASEDYEWLLRAARTGPIVVVPEPLCRVRWHAGSLFSRRWDTYVSGLEYVLSVNPEFEYDGLGRARILGQIAFAHAAAGERRKALRLALRTLRADWRQPRAYLAMAVAAHVVGADQILHRLHTVGRGL
jgi:glycosyltransferase involved in cell wall biosynthesis